MRLTKERMSRLHPEKPKEVIRKLRNAGFEGPFGGGKHVTMRHTDSGKKIPIPIHGGRDIPVGTLRAILRETIINFKHHISAKYQKYPIQK